MKHPKNDHMENVNVTINEHDDHLNHKATSRLLTKDTNWPPRQHITLNLEAMDVSTCFQKILFHELDCRELVTSLF